MKINIKVWTNNMSKNKLYEYKELHTTYHYKLVSHRHHFHIVNLNIFSISNKKLKMFDFENELEMFECFLVL